MSYVDGFVAAVPTANREKFRRHAEEAAVVFKEHGTLAVVECWGLRERRRQAWAVYVESSGFNGNGT